MFPEIGHFSLILAFVFACLWALVPFLGWALKDRVCLSLAKPLTLLTSTLIAISFFILIALFWLDDFSVWYVSTHSNSALPFYYKVSAVWGGHEGSLLLWVVILSGWACAVALRRTHLPEETVMLVLTIMGILVVGFLALLLFTSSPFARILPDIPIEGADLNPLLQDIGLILHPPMLYMGYVGFSVVFAFAITALLQGKLDKQWASWARPWTACAWAFLTLGIVLGSWWAYYELGWGGWWFWDPVENASFMPWLAGTALLHSLAVMEKRDAFKSWTLLLAIFTFSLSLLGAFLVRSGILTSVHSFAADPTRGVFILALLILYVGGALLLYAVRIGQVKSNQSFVFSGREAWLLLNNIFLTVLTLTVLLGTLYPLVFDVFNLGMISVGAPYFNAVFTPIALLLMVFMAVAPLTRWRSTAFNTLTKPLISVALFSGLGALLLTIIAGLPFHAIVSLWVSFWVIGLSGYDNLNKAIKKSTGGGFSLLRRSRRFYAMHLAHLGMAVSLIGILMVSLNSDESIEKIAIGEQVTVGKYEFQFDGLAQIEGPNYQSERGQFTVSKHGQQVAVMHPEKRYFPARGQTMTEAALDPGFVRDLYISLGEPLADGSWSVRIYIKSFVRWIWLGGLMMMLAGVLAISNKRLLKKQREAYFG
ncbi:heme lyase CcmF/NrfE family subunit [Marinomonas epiphytica]